MEGCSRKELEACPHLLDLISKDAEWLTSRDKDRNHGSSEEKKLELRLGPPGEEWSLKSDKERDESILSLGHFSSMASIAHKIGNQIHKFSSQENPVGCVLSSQWSSSYYKKSNQPNQQQTKAPSFPQFPSAPQSLPVAAKEASRICSSKGIDLHGPEKKVFSPSPAVTAVPNSSQKRYSYFLFLSLLCFIMFWTEYIHLPGLRSLFLQSRKMSDFIGRYRSRFIYY